MKYLIRLRRTLDLSIKKYLPLYSSCILSVIMYTVCSLIYPSFISIIIDKGVAKNNVNIILTNVLIFLIIGIFMIIFYYLQKILFTTLTQKIVNDIQNKLIWKLMFVNYEFWNKNKTGDIISIIENDVEKIENILTVIVGDTFINVFVVIGVASYLIYIDPLIGCVVIFLSIIFSLMQKRKGVIVKQGMKALREEFGNLASLTNDIINNLSAIQMEDMVDRMANTFLDSNKLYRKNYINQVKKRIGVQNIAMLFSVFGIFFVLFIGSIRVLQGTMTVGILFSLTMYVQRLYNPIISLSNTYISVKNIVPILDKILNVLESNLVIKNGNVKEIENFVGDINLENLSYKYPQNNYFVFENLNIDIKQGEIVGIVGKNGSGKTTLLRLINKLCIPTEGIVKVSNIDIQDYETRWLWHQVGIMPQAIYLPRGYLKDILDIDSGLEEKAFRLLEELNFDIYKEDSLIDRKIELELNTLSGGEYQKLAFVRLILQNKQIYIFDEPTSALDLKTEKKVIEIIKRELSGKTVLIITHRTPILDICNKVIEII